MSDTAQTLAILAATLALLLAVAWPDLRAARAGLPPVTFEGSERRE